MSSLIPPEFRKLRSSGSPITMSPPVRACTMLSIPSRSAVPGAIISSALIRPGSGLTSLSKSSPDRGATIPHSRALSISLAPPTRRADGACAARSGERGSAGAGCPETGTGRGARAPERVRERLAQARRLARRAAAVGRRDHALAAVLGGLLQAPLGVPYPAQLARQAELAEARPRRATEWLPARRAGNRERHRQVAAGLLEAHPADDVDEHVRRTRAHAAVTSQDREHQRKAVAVEPRDDPARLLELGRRDQRLDLHQQRPRAPRCRASGWPRPRSAPRRRAPPRGRPGASRTGPPRWSSRSGSSARAARGRGARARPRTAARSRRGAQARAGPRARRPWSRGRPGSPPSSA